MEMYRAQPIIYWPDAQDPENPNYELDKVYRLLNPPSHLGNVHGTADERSLIYATGSGDKPQALVFVGFDPAMKLAGLRCWGGMCQKGVGEGPHVAGRASGRLSENECDTGKQGGYVDREEADRTITMSRKGKGKIKCTPLVQTCADAMIAVELGSVKEEGNEVHNRSWAWIEIAMYRDIGCGFQFGLSRQEKP